MAPDRLIKTGGENVASREVEETVYQHPTVAEVAVFGVPDPYWIEMVCAVVVVKPGERPEPEEVVEFCRARLAGFKTSTQPHDRNLSTVAMIMPIIGMVTV